MGTQEVIRSHMGNISLAQRYAAVRAATEALAAPLSPEDQQLQAMPECSPCKWHRAHTTWFFEQFLLQPHGRAVSPPAYAHLFNSYYEAIGDRHPRPQRGLLSRPSCAEVTAYRQAVDACMDNFLSTAEPEVVAAATPLVELGLAHEEQHQELILTDILHAFWHNPLRPAYRSAPRVVSPPAARDIPPLGFVDHPGGLVAIGAGDDAPGFTFDNEHPRHRVWLQPFALATRPICYGEVAAFIAAGGYHTPTLWLSEGAEFIARHQIEAPLYLEAEPGSLRVFTCDGMVEADPAAPAAHLSYYEAEAIARFLGARLPTEAEWEVFAASTNSADANDRANDREAGALRPRRSDGPSDQLGQMFGDVWEWTASAYAAYPGFAPAAGAVGEYNGKFMINQQVLRGGSCLTPRGHASATYRNFWAAGTRFQMTGARLARDISP